MLTLEDSGPGIKPEHLNHLFDSFFTTKDVGIGLGLRISRPHRRRAWWMH
jgi:C4-dicarboxylate-specific signal transduction histidine kinase